MAKLKAKKCIVFFLASAVFCLNFSGCKSDYPVLDRKLDLKEFLEACYDGSGYELDLNDEEKVIVDAVADRFYIDMDASADTVKDIQTAVRNATTVSDGLTGTWSGKVDISPVIWECFESIDGLDLSQYISGIYLPAELSFNSGGTYMLKFSENSVEDAREAILNGAVKATKEYLGNMTGGAASIVVKAIDDNTIKQILDYVVNMAMEMLDNGAAGTYSARNGKLRFDKTDSCSYELYIAPESNTDTSADVQAETDAANTATNAQQDILTISKANVSGVLLALASSGGVQFTRAK